MRLVLQLHQWPDQLDSHIQFCENKHDVERRSLEKELFRRRKLVEQEIADLGATLKDVKSWAEPTSYQGNFEKIKDFESKLAVHEDKMEVLLEQEKVVIGQAGESVKYKKIRADFIPYNDLWTGVDFVMSKKKTWLNCPLTEIDPEEVDTVIKTSRRTIRRLGQ
jgi:hypothetical protein